MKLELGARTVRIFAYLIDQLLVVFPLIFILSMLSTYIQEAICVFIKKGSILYNIESCSVVLLPWALYFPILESSKFQKTIGKHLLGLYVADAENKRLSFLRSLARYIIFFISIGTGILFIQMLFTRVGIHDHLTFSRVWSKRRTAHVEHDKKQDDED